MKVYLNEITGLADAAESLLMSKRSWTPEKARKLRALIHCNTDACGKPVFLIEREFFDQLSKLMKYGVEEKHTTLLRFIDLSFTVEGLHRAGQDDWDAHAKRFDNRIIRASTRLATFSNDEKSDWYKGKILYPFEVLELLDIPMPEYITGTDGRLYTKTDFGYIREDIAKDKDAKRGLYPLAIPSNFIFKIQYPELAHVIQFRDSHGHANPEVQQLAEKIKQAVWEWYPILADNLNKLQMEPGEI